MPTIRRPPAKTLQALVGALVLAISLLAVGLTASADGPFTISIRPVFLRLGVDVNVKLGALHLHASWSAAGEPHHTLAVTWIP